LPYSIEHNNTEYKPYKLYGCSGIKRPLIKYHIFGMSSGVRSWNIT